VSAEPAPPPEAAGTATSPAGQAAAFAAELAPLGLRWHGSGRVSLSGPLARLAAQCDSAFTTLAGLWAAEPEDHPAMLDLAAMQAAGYLSAFPHLATFPVCLAAEEENLRDFTAGPVAADGALRLTRTTPVREVLTPAACYHVFVSHERDNLTVPSYLTTRNTCFRREDHYEPLRRQWSFRMREIVCIGTRAEVTAFLGAAREAASALLRELDLAVAWEAATDPFFGPAGNPMALAQRLQPTKHEAVFGGDLALASVNHHEDHFGAAFGITRQDRPAASGCVAFGIERWVYAFTRRHGTDPRAWPDINAAACGATRQLAVPGDDAPGDGGTQAGHEDAP
jgi:hypothetical protein